MTNSPFSPSQGDIVGIKDTDRRCVVVRFFPSDLVGVRDCGGRSEPDKIHVDLLIPAPPAKPCIEESAVAKGDPDQELSRVDEEDWEKAKLRLKIIQPFLLMRRQPKADLILRARNFGYDVTRLYTWMRRFREGGEKLTALLDRLPSVPKGTRRLSKRLQDLLDQIIDSEYMTPQKQRVTEVHKMLRLKCEDLGIPVKKTPGGPHDCLPHINTVRNYINQRSLRSRAEARDGRGKASKYRVRGEGFKANYPLECVQIDHTQVNVILRDENTGHVTDRPWITVAIDVFSRMIVGYYLSIEEPSALATGICVSQLILPKDDWLCEHAAAFGGKTPEWPCYGRPVMLHADNGKDFRGEMLRRACDQYNINMQFRPLKTPEYGAHIESLVHKLSDAFKTLPGTTFSNPQERGKHYDSGAESAMSFRELSLWLANHICCIYHYREHSSLAGKSPLERWNQGMYEGTEMAPPRGKLPDRYLGDAAERLRLDFVPLEERVISDAGIVIDMIRYMAPVLRRWINAKDPDHPNRSRYFVFRRDPRDISIVYFWNPEAKQYEPIPYRDTAQPAATLRELRAARKCLREQRKIPDRQHTESMIFDAIRRNRDMVEAAMERRDKFRTKGKLRSGIHAGRPKLGSRPPEQAADEQAGRGGDRDNVTGFEDLDHD